MEGLCLEHQTILDDVKEALDEGGLVEALRVLQSYDSAELADPQLLECIIRAVCEQGLSRNPREDFDSILDLQALLQPLGNAAPAAAALLESARGGLLSGALDGVGAVDLASHIELLAAQHELLPRLLTAAWDGSQLQISCPPQGQPYSNLLAGLFYVHLFYTLEPGVAAALASAAVPWQVSSTDAAQAQLRTQAAVEVAVGVLQSYAVRRRLRGSADLQPSCDRALAWLQLFLRGPPAASDAWWGCWAAVVHSLVRVAEQAGMVVLQSASLAPVVRTFCHSGTAYALGPTLLAYPSFLGAKDGTRKALGMAEALLRHDTQALLAACGELLRPESNQALPVRVEVLQAMGRAADRYLSAHPVDQDARLALWTADSLAVVTLALTRDPSIRVRREAMRLLSSVSVRVDTPAERELLHVVTSKCRDKDEHVRRDAFAMLAQFPSASLAGLDPRVWQGLLDLAFRAAAAAQDAGSSKQLSKPAAAILGTAKQLLKRLLLRSCGPAPSSGGSTPTDDGSWLERLAAVRPLGGRKGEEGQLAEAWEAALREILPPHMLAAADITWWASEAG